MSVGPLCFTVICVLEVTGLFLRTQTIMNISIFLILDDPFSTASFVGINKPNLTLYEKPPHLVSDP